VGKLVGSRGVAAVLAMALAAMPLAAKADSARDFFKGKVITYVVATSPGGGYDTYGRLIARFMQKAMPGTKIIVRNVPGGGNVVGANTIYAAKPDGLTIGIFNTGLLFLQLLKDKSIQFDLTKMSWIGTAASDTRVLVLRKDLGITKPEQLFKASAPRLKLYCSGAGSASYYDAKTVVYALHMNAELLTGYSGSEGAMSMMRHEADGTIGSESSDRQFVQNVHGVFVMEIGGAPGSKLPQAEAYARTEDGKKLLAIVAAESRISRLTVGPPGIAPDRLAVLRQGFAKALADPELLAQAKKMGIPIGPIDGDTTARIVHDALNQSPQNVALLTQAVK